MNETAGAVRLNAASGYANDKAPCWKRVAVKRTINPYGIGSAEVQAAFWIGSFPLGGDNFRSRNQKCRPTTPRQAKPANHRTHNPYD